MKKIIFWILLVHCFSTYAQKKWADIKLDNGFIFGEVIPIHNSETGFTAVFLKGKSASKCYLLNNAQELVQTLTINSLPKNFDVFVGSVFKAQKLTLFYTNTSNSKHGCVSMDFDRGTSMVYEELNLNLKKDRLISYIEDQNEFYALSIIKNSSTLNLQRFDLDGKMSAFQFDLSNEKFETDNELPLSLDALMFGKHSDGTVEFIDTSVPTTLETATALTKVYLSNNLVTITNNTFQKLTYRIQLDLKSQSFKLSKFENEKFEKRNLRNNANSFVLNSLLFNVYSDTEEIVFKVFDTDSNALIRNFSIKSGDSISFKNSPIIHEVGNTNTYRDLEKTARLIRKVNTSNIGISAYPYQDNYIVTLGSSEKIQSGEFAIIGGVLGGVLGAALLSAFDSYNRTQSTRIICIFDKQFIHVKGEVPKNGFDLIQDFINEKSLSRSTFQTVFKYEEAYIWGFYEDNTFEYRFFQFIPN